VPGTRRRTPQRSHPTPPCKRKAKKGEDSKAICAVGNTETFSVICMRFFYLANGIWEPLRASVCCSWWPSPGSAVWRGPLQGPWCGAGLLLAGESSELLVLLFGGGRGPPGAFPAPAGSGGPGHSLPRLLLGLFLLRGDGSGSSGAAARCPPTAAHEVPRSSSVPDLAGLPGEAETLLRRQRGRGHLGQHGHDGVFHHGCLQPPVVKDLLQLLLDPGLQGLQEHWVVLEKVHPIRGTI